VSNEKFPIRKKDKENTWNVQNKRGHSHMYVENIVDNDVRQDDIRQKEEIGEQTKNKYVEQKRRYWVEEETNNREFMNDEISRKVADRVYNREPKEKQLKEQAEQEGAAAKKLTEQKIDTSESETSKEKVMIDTLNSINDNITKAKVYLDAEHSAKINKFENCMKIFAEAVSSGKIIMNEEQTKTFIDFGKHNKVVDEASAKNYFDFALTKVLPFVAGAAIFAGIVLGVEQPLSGLSKINSLLSPTPSVNNINKLGNLGDSLLR